MSGAAGAAGARETEEFAAQLRELKDRSGLSYGALSKRLHMSTSTLHRYCQGTAIPNDYAPVERLARLCRATPQELVELHRRWVVADAARKLRADDAAATRAGAFGSGGSGGPGGATADPVPPSTERATAPESAPAPALESAAAKDAPPADSAPGGSGDDPRDPVVRVARGSAAPRRRRTTLITSAAVAAVLVAGVLIAHPWDRGGDGDGNAAGDHRAAGAGASTGTAGTGTAPLTIGTRPYVYDNPCYQHFLVDTVPAQVGPPPNEQDAPRWAAAYGGVSSGEQMVALTVQGSGAETVVLEALHMRVITKGAPLAWNDYAMGVGCGSGVETKSFDIDLDNGRPMVKVINGQRDFPYKVSETDPEVFYITAHTKAHDVTWDLSLDWSSGSRRGTVRIDNKGTPFRTSADVDRPGYDYMLGGTEWTPRFGGS